MNIGKLVILVDESKVVLGKYKTDNGTSITLYDTLHIAKRVSPNPQKEHLMDHSRTINWNEMVLETQKGFKYSASTMMSTFEKNGAQVYRSKNKIISALRDKGLYSLADKLE